MAAGPGSWDPYFVQYFLPTDVCDGRSEACSRVRLASLAAHVVRPFAAASHADLESFCRLTARTTPRYRSAANAGHANWYVCDSPVLCCIKRPCDRSLTDSHTHSIACTRHAQISRSIDVLLANGADVGATTSDNGFSALMYASRVRV